MKKVEIKIGNEVFPCRQTMGAMLRFKQETGREVTEIDATSFTDICTFLWCCIVSASKADGKKFKLSLMDFADSVSPEDMNEWAFQSHLYGIESGGHDTHRLQGQGLAEGCQP